MAYKYHITKYCFEKGDKVIPNDDIFDKEDFGGREFLTVKSVTYYGQHDDEIEFMEVIGTFEPMYFGLHPDQQYRTVLR